MKAISLWQPWATLWVTGEKRYETRSWYTDYRGPLLVHAAKQRDAVVRDAIADPAIAEALARHGLTHIAQLAFGAIVGQVRLTDCRRMDAMRVPGHPEDHFGDWKPERFAWEASYPELLFPVPYQGKQGFFNVGDWERLYMRTRTDARFNAAGEKTA